MVGGQELERLRLQKQALILESDLNRLRLQAECQNLQSTTAWLGEATRTWRTIHHWLPALAPLAGLLVARGCCQSDSLLSRLLSLAKWIKPLHALWKRYGAGQKEADAPKAPVP